jgi:hypothetical protein
MLPTTGARVLGALGILSGCVAIFLAEWGIEGVPDFLWKICSLVAVCALISMRLFPSRTVDTVSVRARAGDTRVDKLINLRRLAIIIVILALIISLLFGSVLAAPVARHAVLVIGFGLLLFAVSIFIVVEVRFRSLMRPGDTP